MGRWEWDGSSGGRVGGKGLVFVGEEEDGDGVELDDDCA